MCVIFEFLDVDDIIITFDFLRFLERPLRQLVELLSAGARPPGDASSILGWNSFTSMSLPSNNTFAWSSSGPVPSETRAGSALGERILGCTKPQMAISGISHHS